MSKYLLRALMIAGLGVLPLTACETTGYDVKPFSSDVGDVFVSPIQSTGGAIGQVGEWGAEGFSRAGDAIQSTGEAITGGF